MPDENLSRSQRKRLAQKEEYLVTAHRLFSEKGFENTSVEAISEAVDMGHGSFYYYFSSKDEMAALIHIQGVRKLKNRFLKIMAKDRSMLESIELAGKAYIKFHEEYAFYLDIIKAIRTGHKKGYINTETLEDVYREFWEGIIITFKKILEKFNPDGQFKNYGLEEISVISWAIAVGFAEFKEHLLSEYSHLNIDTLFRSIIDIVYGFSGEESKYTLETSCSPISDSSTTAISKKIRLKRYSYKLFPGNKRKRQT